MTDEQENLKQHILNEIRRLANELGQAPGVRVFAQETGIAQHMWDGRLWARWGDAVAEAGHTTNTMTGRRDSDIILGKLIEACRHYGKLPTRSEINLYKQRDKEFPDPKTITRHFGSRADLIETLLAWIISKDGFEDIARMLPRIKTAPGTPVSNNAKTQEGFVYLIKSGDFYKIGRSDDIERRVKEIRISLPDKAILIHTIRTDDPAGIEAYWHNRFKDKRANGEWFKLSAADLVAVKKRKFQ
jgi:hypothetical protein